MAFRVFLFEAWFDGTAKDHNCFAVVLFRFVNTRWARPVCLVCRKPLTRYGSVLNEMSCYLSEQSVNVYVFFFAHGFVSAGKEAWTSTVVHSNRASVLLFQGSVIEMRSKWETVVVGWGLGTYRCRNDGTMKTSPGFSICVNMY